MEAFTTATGGPAGVQPAGASWEGGSRGWGERGGQDHHWTPTGEVTGLSLFVEIRKYVTNKPNNLLVIFFFTTSVS